MTPCKSGARAAGLDVRYSTGDYTGSTHWLAIWGAQNPALKMHIDRGLPATLWDIGYFGRGRDDSGHLRVALDAVHPTLRCMDLTEPDPSRWNKRNIELRDVHDPHGHVLVIGLGKKTRSWLGRDDQWEKKALADAAQRFPNHRVVYRPKPAHGDSVQWRHQMAGMSIDDALRGASLVICRHSNVAIDACIAGVPVQCEAGAAYWLYRQTSTPTREQRLDFLYRLCWWNWQKTGEDMKRAWEFLLAMRRRIEGRQPV